MDLLDELKNVRQSTIITTGHSTGALLRITLEYSGAERAGYRATRVVRSHMYEYEAVSMGTKYSVITAKIRGFHYSTTASIAVRKKACFGGVNNNHMESVL